MKKRYLIPLYAAACILFFPAAAYAGDINSAEQGIISTISSTYEYNGAYYKVTDAYISQVSAYLNQDEIDLTQEQASDYLTQFYANISTGITSGYMEKIGDVETPGGGTQTPPVEEPQTGQENESSQAGNTNTENSSINVSGTNVSGTGVPVQGNNSSAAENSEETESAAEIMDNTIGSTQSGKIEYTVTPMSGTMYVWDIDALDIHEEAYKDSEVIGSIPKGESVKVTGAATTGWAQIEYEDATGYVSAAYLRTQSYMQSIGVEVENPESEEITTETETETMTEETAAETESKDYSDADPVSKTVKIEMITVGIVVVFILVSAAIVLLHKNKKR